ncbi:MAG: NAD(+) synthase, partial [Oscillospiraceae bacterium]
MNSLIRVCTGINRVSVANPPMCYEDISFIVSEAIERQSDIILLPQLAFCSPACGKILHNPSLASSCQTYLSLLCENFKAFTGYLIVGLPVWNNDCVTDVMAVISSGSVLALLPCENSVVNNPSVKENTPLKVFEYGSLRFCVITPSRNNLAARIIEAAATGCELILFPSYNPVTVGYNNKLRKELSALSDTLGVSIAFTNGGIGDTSQPFLFSGSCGLYECGNEFYFVSADLDNSYSMMDIDVDIIRSDKKFTYNTEPVSSVNPTIIQKDLMRLVCKNPFLSGNKQDDDSYFEELFAMQVKSLTCRIQNTGITKLVIGVSGGLDSTLALLVACEALCSLGLEASNLIGITMPGFGTSDRTYYNALALIEQLGATYMDIPIKNAVMVHFDDIGHNVGTHDVTYENAQARERTQILFDIANKYRGLVVGTGDLSEGALGWCTFSGDHMASYNVNICITKTNIRKMVAYLSEKHYTESIALVLQDILDTPVSPELLPLDENGEIAQCTEEILGPYELHDFFLYYFVKYNMRPDKIFYYACVAFG